jgi:hypothetical protein
MPYFITLLQSTHLKDSRKSTFSILWFFYYFLWIYKVQPTIDISGKRKRRKTKTGLNSWGMTVAGPPLPKSKTEGGNPALIGGPYPSYTRSRRELRRAVSRRRRLLWRNRAHQCALHVTPHHSASFPQPLLHWSMLADGNGGHGECGDASW